MSLPEFKNRVITLSHMVKGQRLKHFRLFVVIITVYPGGGLLETDVVETLETCTVDVGYFVIWHEEMFLQISSVEMLN
jgi:hypothetical protein